jgi:hypothetical protein
MALAKMPGATLAARGLFRVIHSQFFTIPHPFHHSSAAKMKERSFAFFIQDWHHLISILARRTASAFMQGE